MKTKIFLVVLAMLFSNCQEMRVAPQCLTGIIIGSTDGCNTLIQVENVPYWQELPVQGAELHQRGADPG